MTPKLTIQSRRGPYSVYEYETVNLIAKRLASDPRPMSVVMDAHVAHLHETALAPLLERGRIVRVDATEENKSLARMEDYVESLMEAGARRDHVLIAVGGGIIQDISCFLASTLFRGMAWELVPTTLLAQADSCIGSKSSINVGKYKNLLGTFVPPDRIHLTTSFLSTLDEDAIRSGIGEIYKVHILDSLAAFDATARTALTTEPPLLRDAIWRSLAIKQKYIEVDELDRNLRNVLNYGHSFGHAIESATRFAVPHGIAVSLGMDLANHVSSWRGELPLAVRDHLHTPLVANAGRFAAHPVPLEQFVAALGRDKKNEGMKFCFILLDEKAQARKVLLENTPELHHVFSQFFASVAAEK